MSKWPKYRIKDVCSVTSSTRIRSSEYQEDGVPFYRGKEIIEKQRGALKVSTDIFIPRERFEEVRRKGGAPKAGELLLTSVGTLGVPYVVRDGEEFYFKDGNLTWFRGFQGLHGRYLYYWLLSPLGKAELKKCVIGSSQPAYTIVLLKEMEIDCPSLQIQHQITGILSAYDDLIENNTRRIEILEEMARRLYEEWFVQFRFPGHEGVEFKESELGLIPEGWGIQPLYDVAEVTYGHPFKASQFNEDGVGLGIVRIRDIKAGEVKTYTSEEGKPKHLIENGDILIGMDGQFHMGKWAGGQAWLVQRVARFRPIQVGRYFLFLSLERPIKHLENTIVGTTVAHLSAKDLQKLHVVVPEKAVLDAASAFLEPLYDLEMKLRRKNANLRAQRDLLIPKLISGEIDVSDIPMPT
ncbi:restriction endonuclease subunit S [Pseudomonas putida]|uniref:restriction endonuclease subunit S n=1 Tax=Pseudomonas putida TaxID=303 RepID=UPI00370C9BA5